MGDENIGMREKRASYCQSEYSVKGMETNNVGKAVSTHFVV